MSAFEDAVEALARNKAKADTAYAKQLLEELPAFRAEVRGISLSTLVLWNLAPIGFSPIVAEVLSLYQSVVEAEILRRLK